MVERKTSLIEGPIAGPLLAFMLPILLSSILQQLYNMADTIIVGRFAGLEALAGVGAGYSLTRVYTSIAFGAGIGAAVLTGQYFGARRLKETKESISTSLVTFTGAAVVLMVLSRVFLRQILTALRVPQDAMESAFDYLRVCLYGLPFIFIYNDISSIFNALGKSRYPLLFLVVSVFFNVVLDLVMVARMGLGAFGAALATVLAQGISAVLSFALLMKEMKGLDDGRDAVVFRVSLVGRILRLAVPSLFSQTVISFGMMVVQAAVNVFGSASLAGYTACMRIDGIVVAPYSAISTALGSFIAQNIGARKLDRISKAMGIGLTIMFSFSVFSCLVVQLFGRNLVSLFLSGQPSEVALNVGSAYLGFCGWFYWVLGLKIVLDAVLRGSGDMRWYFIANVVNLAIRIFVSYAFSPIHGIQVIWYAVPIDWAAGVIFEASRVATGKWKTIMAM
ncbi:MAG: MATE family efflux transporter [Spirochaetales bacterium]|nr:MATE family efflux transporter [Spirochaetales bacterium]